MDLTANVIDIVRGTTVDGPGFRTSVYFAGCHHCCEGCHNPESWDFNAGTPMTVEDIMHIIREEDFDVTLSGGDPLYRPDFTRALISEIRMTGHTVWIYTGFRWEEIIENSTLLEVIKDADVIVDSPFVLSLRDTDLLFKGSSNQRIIDVKKSIEKFSKIPSLWQR